MRKKRVEFLRYFNDYRMLAIFPSDIVAMAVLPFFIFFTIFTMGNAGLAITVLGSIAISTLLVMIYKKAKEDTSKGFLKHWAFNKGIFILKKDKKRWKELQHTDNDSYFPNGQDRFFAD